MMIDITPYKDMIEAALDYTEVCEIYFGDCEGCPLYGNNQNEDYDYSSDPCANMPYVPHDLLMQFAASILLSERVEMELPEYAMREDEERALMYEMNIGTEDMQKVYDDGEFENDNVADDDKKEQ
jgi:hypothetical protein